MAQKAKKELAQRNTTRLNQTLYFTLAIHAFYLFFRVLLFRSSLYKSSLLKYILLSTPSLLIEFWFESIARPKYTTSPTSSSTSEKGDLRSAGEDLSAPGLTEFLWDVLYWSWGCIVFAAAFGDRAWWLMVVIPGYAGYLGWTMTAGARKGLLGSAGRMGEGGDDEMGRATGPASGSKRQAKLEKRGGQRVAYR